MFEVLERLPADPILASFAAYRADTDPAKVDLGIGVYRDDHGATPIPAAVKRAEAAMLARQQTKAYVGSVGNPAFNRRSSRWSSAIHMRRSRRVACAPSSRPAGAVRCALARSSSRPPHRTTIVYVSTPTWANHAPLSGVPGSACELSVLRQRARRHRFRRACWRLADAARRQRGTAARLLPQSDGRRSYRGSNGASCCRCSSAARCCRSSTWPIRDWDAGIAEDAYGIRLFAAELPELLIAVSCSKNFGLYRERAGTLHVVATLRRGRRGGAEPPRAHRAQYLFDAAGSRRSDRRGAAGRCRAACRVARGGRRRCARA